MHGMIKAGDERCTLNREKVAAAAAAAAAVEVERSG